jgi:hypothetical protein
MLKNKLAAGEYLKIANLIKTLVKLSLKELEGDGLSWPDVLKFLKSDELQMQILEILGSFLAERDALHLSQSAPFDVASASLQAADLIVQRYKDQRLAEFASMEATVA